MWKSTLKYTIQLRIPFWVDLKISLFLNYRKVQVSFFYASILNFDTNKCLLQLVMIGVLFHLASYKFSPILKNRQTFEQFLWTTLQGRLLVPRNAMSLTHFRLTWKYFFMFKISLMVQNNFKTNKNKIIDLDFEFLFHHQITASDFLGTLVLLFSRQIFF